MGLFPHSFKFQMDSLYISWQLSRSRIEEKKKKDESWTKRACKGEEESGVPSGGGTEWKTFPLLSVSVFTRPLSPHPGSKPWTFEKTSPRFSSPFPGVVCNNDGSVTVESLCIHRLSPSLQARDLPPACFLDSYSITNQQGQKEEEEEEEEEEEKEKWGADMPSITIESCFVTLFPKTYWSNLTRALQRKKKEGRRNAVWMDELLVWRHHLKLWIYKIPAERSQRDATSISKVSVFHRDGCWERCGTGFAQKKKKKRHRLAFYFMHKSCAT